MNNAQRNMLKSYFAGVLPFCNRSKVVSLLAGLGYNASEVTADLCVQAYEEQGKDFFQPFGNIALNAVDSPKFIAYKKVITQNARQSLKISRADGKQGAAVDAGSAMTSQQKAEMGLNYIDRISGLFGKGIDAYNNTQNKKANEIAAEAALLNAQTAASEQQGKTTNKWLIPVLCGVGALVLVVVLVVVLGKRK